MVSDRFCSVAANVGYCLPSVCLVSILFTYELSVMYRCVDCVRAHGSMNIYVQWNLSYCRDLSNVVKNRSTPHATVRVVPLCINEPL